MGNNYVVYHLHDDEGSLLDSCTKFTEYVDIAKSLGMEAIASTNHGYNLNWTSKKLYAEKNGLKYIFGIEAYLTAKLYHEKYTEGTEVIEPAKTMVKYRDNFHTILLAKSSKGVTELNRLLNKSYDEDHKYYKPRISFDEFFELSDQVIKISACLASPLRNYNENEPEFGPDVYDKLCRTYDYYEIQAHDCEDQIEYNKYLYELSKKYNKPLIAATDTHSSTPYKAECRKLLMLSKGIEFTGEDEFDLTFKSYDELVAMFRMQNALPEEVWMQAIENTNAMADSIKPFKLSTATRYPIVYGSYKEDENKYVELTHKMLNEKIRTGIIPASEVDAFRNDIEEELAVFKKTNMLGFMLSISSLMRWCKSNGIPVGPARGSVAGSRCAFVTDIIDVDPVKWNTVFSRFCNENRVETGDVDVDVPDEYREKVYNHIFKTFGDEKCAYVLALGTISAKGTIDDIGRAMARIWERNNPDQDKINNPYSLKAIAKIKDELDADADKCRAAHPDLFYYFDGMVDTVVSLSHHPAGIVISPLNVRERYGIIIDKDGLPVMNLDMSAGHAVGVCKYDILGLDTVSLIDKTCKYAKIKYPHTWQIDFEDRQVWNDMKRSPVGLFQFVKDFAFESLKRYNANSVEDVCAVTAAIRPSGASYRDRLLNHEKNTNPSKEIDDLLEKNSGFLIYQEDTIAFLQKICGLSGSDADTIRRAIGHKDEKAIAEALPRIMAGYCANSPKEKSVAESECKAFLKIIEDSASYQFGYLKSKYGQVKPF